MYYCEPAWHNGDRHAPAAFLIRPADAGPPLAPSFAACEEHAGRAIRLMMTRHGWSSAVARDVSGRVERAAEQAQRA